MNPASAPSLDHLRILTAVVDAGSFSAAARQLDRSQPAISYGIAALEEQLGLTLFERGKRKPTLTASGVAVLAYARRLCQLADELTASASSLTAGLEGQLVIGIDTFFPEEHLAATIAKRAVLAIARQEPHAHRNLRGVEKLARQGDHAIHMVSLNQGLARWACRPVADALTCDVADDVRDEVVGWIPPDNFRRGAEVTHGSHGVVTP